MCPESGAMSRSGHVRTLKNSRRKENPQDTMVTRSNVTNSVLTSMVTRYESLKHAARGYRS